MIENEEIALDLTFTSFEWVVQFLFFSFELMTLIRRIFSYESLQKSWSILV